MSLGQFPPNLGLLLVLPDAVAQGLIPAIGDHLAQHDLRPVGVAAEILTERHRSVLYDESSRSKYSATGRVHGPVMTRRLLALDNCLAVLVAGDVPGQDVSTLLHDMKGPSSFLQRKPGSLRTLSSPADRCMSLIHTPDNASEAARDAALFFPAVHLDPARGGRELDWELVQACRAWAAPSPHESRYSIAARTILRCAALLLGGIPGRCGPFTYGVLWEIYDVCRSWLAGPPLPDTPQEHKRFLRLCAAIDPPAAAVCGAGDPRDDCCLQIMRTLTDPEGYDHEAGLRVLELLERARLALTPYEAHHLLTLLTFLKD